MNLFGLSIEKLWLFALAVMLLALTPGPVWVYLLSRTLTQGRRAGYFSLLGVAGGVVVHVTLAALGISVVLLAVPFAFDAIKLAGAAYLVYLGIQLVRAAKHELAVSADAPRSLWRLFLDGALSNVSNPKIAVFYFAFLPQFVLPGATHPTLSVFVLGLVFAGLTFLVKGPVGLGAGLLSGWLRSRPKVIAWLHRTSGAILIGLGLKLAFERRA